MTAHRSPDASPRTVLVVATLSQVSVSAVNFGLPSIGPDLRAEFSLSLAELGAVLTAGLLGSGIALVAAGIAVDRLGTRRPMRIGVSVATAGLVTAALASSTTQLLLGLLVFGLGSSVVPVAGAGELFRAYPASRRGRALGIRQMAVPLGGIVASLAFPGLRALGGVQLALLVVAGAVLATGWAFAAAAGAAPPPGERRRESEWTAFRTIARAPGMPGVLTVAALYIVVLQALLVFTVPALRDAGLSPLLAGAAFVILNATAIVSRIAWGLVADRGGGTRRTRTLAEIGCLAAVGSLLFAGALHAGFWLIVPSVVVFGFGALGWNAIVYVTAAERAGVEYAARAVGLASTVVFVLSSASSPVMGALAARAGWDVTWLVTCLLASAGATVALRIPRRPSGRKTSPRAGRPAR